MEPRPPSRRDATTIAAPPAADPNGQGPGPSGGYPPTMPGAYPQAMPSGYPPAGPFDPYTAPEAQAQPPYGPTAGYPGDSSTRLGPLADEPVFYPNPGLPPNRPAYDPLARYDARSEYALHPVGRVPPDHQPLNLRPAPPPVPPQIAPPERNNLIKGILAGVIGLVAVAALVAAVLTFANGGFGGDDSSPPATVPVVAGQPGGAPAGLASPSASPVGSVAAGAPVVPPATSPAPAASATGSDPAGEARSSDAPASDAPASEAAETSTDASVAPSRGAANGAGASPRASGSAGTGARTAGAGDITAFLPSPESLPTGFDAPSDEGDRTLSEVAGTFVLAGEDATQAEADLEQWGWVDNQYIAYDAAPQPPDEDINRYAVSVHEFETEGGATDALPAFVEAFGVDPVQLPDGTDIGDEIVALQTTNDDGNLVVLYVRSGVFLLKIDAASVAGDPLPAALELAGQLVGP